MNDFKINGKAVGQTLFGSYADLRKEDEDTGVLHLTADVLRMTGETSIHSIECTLACVDSDYQTLYSCPVRLELEYDARGLLGPAQ